MTKTIDLYINNVLKDFMEWSASGEEIVGTGGRATFVVQDRDLTWEPETHWDVKAVVHSSGWVLFRGEIVREPVELPVGEPYRRWKLECSDYNNQLPQRLVGAIDGNTWIDADGFGDYIAIDPYAESLATDRETIIALFDHYIRINGEAIDTATYVGQYLVPESFAKFRWTYSTLQKVLEELASLITVNLQSWIDPDLKFHWVAIPSWQELLQEGSAAPLARMMPQIDLSLLGTPPVTSISDVKAAGTIGCRKLRFEFDGSEQPEQVYVKGGTGFVLNNGIDPIIFNDPTAVGADATKQEALDAIKARAILAGFSGSDATVLNTYNNLIASGHSNAEIVAGVAAGSFRPVPLYPGKYQITFLAATTIYHTDTNGYISLPGTSVSTAPVYANLVGVPVNTADKTGGTYYRIASGPYTGWLVSPKTNSLAIGEIFVMPAIGAADCATPEEYEDIIIGSGGSGWAGYAIQDPNQRQSYLEAPYSVDQSTREAAGGQTLYRGQYPTLRGSCVVSGGIDPNGETLGPDGWRAGMSVPIIDARLPSTLNGRRFIIQRVGWKLYAGTDVREYTLDWGDGPTQRQTQQRPPLQPTPPPAVKLIILVKDLNPEPTKSQVIEAQLASSLGVPWAIADRTVYWTVCAFDVDDNIIAGQGSFDPAVSETDRDGVARTTFTAGDQRGVFYRIVAETPVL